MVCHRFLLFASISIGTLAHQHTHTRRKRMETGLVVLRMGIGPMGHARARLIPYNAPALLLGWGQSLLLAQKQKKR
uniref:Putative secreted protein n=1 Tax=Anopheles triannulatus TaxID=58253 RepID=A0A2M4B4Y2_9DIPT